ncbi:uncharacterized protein TOL2_C34180 [Desulfobacula toluolica Tol2]|uniref:Uncharacterized protein n=1 Tax=Desulfobacula toluolica (strain DSM 7467 / Tol2) TaxID=651182 RepID=K0NLF9_DESTT|nr:uncharacterized protein TOL2_C34180 [Desulfobacula toluolica Tol2]
MGRQSDQDDPKVRRPAWYIVCILRGKENYNKILRKKKGCPGSFEINGPGVFYCLGPLNLII